MISWRKMLRVGSIRWKGKCGRHPAYNPEDGEGAIRGGCERCHALLDIFRQHTKLVRAMREFGPMQDRPMKPSPKRDGLQPSLFEQI